MSESENSTLSLHFKAVIAALWTGNLFAPFLMSGVAAILPSIGDSLGAPAVMLSLIMVCYNLGQSISHMLSGRIADMFGVKRILLAGVGCFCLFSVFMGLAPSMGVLIPLRFAQGIAAAAISCTVTTLSVTLAQHRRFGRLSRSGHRSSGLRRADGTCRVAGGILSYSGVEPGRACASSPCHSGSAAGREATFL